VNEPPSLCPSSHRRAWGCHTGLRHARVEYGELDDEREAGGLTNAHCARPPRPPWYRVPSPGDPQRVPVAGGAAPVDQGDAPLAEIAKQVGLRPFSVHYQPRELEQKGAIVRERHQPRGIRFA
jgi:hypothetical protein